MKRLFLLSILLCACSQGDTHPGIIGDCPPTCEGGTTDAKSPVDAAKDVTQDVASPDDAGEDATVDAPDDTGIDASLDAPEDADDGGALLDTGADQ